MKAIHPTDSSKISQENTNITINNIGLKEARATSAVEVAENASPKTKVLHDAAEKLVTALPASPVKNDLEARLKVVEDEINLFGELNNTLSFSTSLEVEQNQDDPEFEINNAINGEEIEVVYPSTVSRSWYEKRVFMAVGTVCDITLENLNTTKAGRKLPIKAIRRKNGIEGNELHFKIEVKPTPNLPEKPDDLPDTINIKWVNKYNVKATLKDPTHTVEVFDKKGIKIPWILIVPDPKTGEFDFDITAKDIGCDYNSPEEDFTLHIKNGKGALKKIKIKANITGLKDKVEIQEKPDFEIPTHDFVEGELYSFPIKLKNAVKGGYANIHILDKDWADVPGGKKDDLLMGQKWIMTLNILGKIRLPKDGQYTVRITYNDNRLASSPSTTETEELFFEAKKAPDRIALAVPEGIPDTIDITSEPYNISGKVRDKSHVVEILNDVGGSLTPPLKPIVKDDGTFSVQLPKFLPGEYTNKYKIRVSDGSGRAPIPTPVNLDITTNKKIPPKANMWIIENEHDFVHKCEHVKKDPTHPEHFFINGEWQFNIWYEKNWIKKNKFIAYGIPTKSATGVGTKDIEAPSPEELYKKIQEHLKAVNSREKNEYNARWWIAPEPTQEKHDDKHKPGDHDEKDNGKKKDHTWDEKGGHGEKGGNKNSAWFFGAVKTIVTTPVTLFNKQPAWIRWAEIGLGYAAWAGGAVSLGPAIMGGAAFGATWWALKKLWNIKNGTKWGDSSGAHH